jgi:hypothetical protein
MRKKRKRGKEQNDDVSGQEGSSPSRLPKAKAPKKGKSKNDRALQKATGQVSQRLMHQDDSKQPWSCTFLLENRPVDEGDSVLKSGKGVRGGEVAEAVGKALLLPEDMKVWQEKRSKHMLENLKRDSILVSFEALYSNVSLYMLDELFIHMYIFHFISFFHFFFRPFKVYLRLATDFWRPNVASTSLERKSNVSRILRSQPLQKFVLPRAPKRVLRPAC